MAADDEIRALNLGHPGSDKAGSHGARKSGKDLRHGAISDTDLDATQLYLSEIGFTPLLSAEQEVMFAPSGRAAVMLMPANV